MIVCVIMIDVYKLLVFVKFCVVDVILLMNVCWELVDEWVEKV